MFFSIVTFGFRDFFLQISLFCCCVLIIPQEVRNDGCLCGGGEGEDEHGQNFEVHFEGVNFRGRSIGDCGAPPAISIVL